MREAKREESQGVWKREIEAEQGRDETERSMRDEENGRKRWGEKGECERGRKAGRGPPSEVERAKTENEDCARHCETEVKKHLERDAKTD